ncbi:MAG: LD-carboxypeptidase [Pseudomonadota bacterium]|nr:MAG: LD-carboxypeptidase [Pseudomonadota bacterium]
MAESRPLRAGDLVAIVAPSGTFPEDRLRKGEAVLLSRGYRVLRLLPREPHRYLAGCDEERRALLERAFAEPEVRAVFAARGGYGATRLLGILDWELVAQGRKPLVGFSDVTALHAALHVRGVRSVHGPVVTRLGEEPPDSLERLFGLLESDRPPPPLVGRTVVAGEAEGPLVGGCLSLLVALLGTPHFPRLDGAILFLEDVGEAPYRLDRMLTQLRASGALDRVAGIALGEWAGCDDSTGQGGVVAEEILAELGRPLLAGLPFGHGARNLALVHGARARLRDGALFHLEGLW